MRKIIPSLYVRMRNDSQNSMGGWGEDENAKYIPLDMYHLGNVDGIAHITCIFLP